MSKSPVLSADPVTGFGGNGLNGGFVNPVRPNPWTMCVIDGAFANWTVPYDSGSLRPHCLNHGFNDGIGNDWGKYQQEAYKPARVKGILESNGDFASFATELENVPHGAIHQAVGGDMVPSSSPGGKVQHHCASLI